MLARQIHLKIEEIQLHHPGITAPVRYWDNLEEKLLIRGVFAALLQSIE